MEALNSEIKNEMMQVWFFLLEKQFSKNHETSPNAYPTPQ